MKNLAIVIATVTLIIGTATVSFASDWDKAGKALAVIEGVRVITGGNVDVIGTVTGINKSRDRDRDRERLRDCDRNPGRNKGWIKQTQRYECEQVWVPHYVWKEKYVPEHIEYRPGIGEVRVQAYTEKYLVEEGGHWEKVMHCALR